MIFFNWFNPKVIYFDVRFQERGGLSNLNPR